MKRAGCIVLFLVALCVSAATADEIDKIFAYRTLGGIEVAPHGRRAVFVATVADLEENASNSDLWVADLANGRSFQLTRGPKQDNAPAWSPDGTRIAFLSDRSGKTNIWMIRPDGGEAIPATEFEKLSVGSFRWLPDGSGFVFTAVDPPTPEEERRKKEKEDPIRVDRDFKYARLYHYRLGDKDPTKLTAEDYHVNDFDVSPDGRGVAFSAQPTPEVPDFYRSDVKLLDLESGEVRDLVNRPGLDTGPRFSPDGQWIAFRAAEVKDAWVGNTRLHVVRRDGTGLRDLSQAFDENVGVPEWSPEGDWIYFVAGERVARRLFRLQVASGRFEAVSEHDQQRVVDDFDLSRDGGFAVVALSDAETPAEVYRLRFSGNRLEKLTAVNAEFEDTGPAAELVRYRSADGLDLEGIVLKPRDFQTGKRYPLLVVIHGGPAGVFTYSFTPRRSAYPLHAFAAQGYVVFLPNPRGSGGHGERFRRANFKDWGYGDYDDIMRGVDLLVRNGVADPERMGVMGWSYGGYMTSWVVTQTDRFKAASMGAGLSNLVSMYGTTDIPEFLGTHMGGRPWDDMREYLRHSAINFVGNARTPTLIQHGRQDRRVPLSQGEEFYQALKDVGVPVEMVIYPRQPHGIREPRLQRDALEHNLRWFNKWVLGLEATEKEK